MENISHKIEDGISEIIVNDSFGSEETIIYEVGRNSSLRFSLLAKGNLNNSKIIINLKENAELFGYFADFSENNEKVSVEINLLESGAKCEWHLASLASKNDKKEFDVSVYHFAPSTFAKMDNYGVCKDDAKLVFSGVSKIDHGASSSKTHQNAKIMVFDALSNAVAKPILKIDENDIEASHAAVVGKINDDHLFYLTSRGLSEATAKELITLGYLKPILNGFEDDEHKDEIMKLIEAKM